MDLGRTTASGSGAQVPAWESAQPYLPTAKPRIGLAIMEASVDSIKNAINRQIKGMKPEYLHHRKASEVPTILKWMNTHTRMWDRTLTEKYSPTHWQGLSK